MISPLHILHLEDDARDAALIQSTLEAEGIANTTIRVQSRNDFVAALEAGGIDLVLSDFSLPAFDGLSAIAIVRHRWPELPIILVSGTLGEELAIDSLKSGATDYVVKERLGRLAPAVLRAMQEVNERTGNRRTEEALLKSEQRLRILFSESPLGIALVDINGHPILTNATLQEMLGYTDEELRGMAFPDFTFPDDRAADMELFQQLVRGTHKSYKIEKRFIHKNGQVVWARLSVSAARGGAGSIEFLIGMVEDITERRQMEAQFIESQKMEVIGQLASGVAHDFNNILAVIMGYSDLIRASLEADSPARGYTDEISHATERAAGLTRQLLVFSRKETVQPVVLDLCGAVHDMDKMLRRLIGENIEMTIVPSDQTCRIKADMGYIGQLLMNLAVNARDAMPDGGKLTLAIEDVTLDGNLAHLLKDTTPGDYVMLSVSDTGSGMSADVKTHLFEAFFTTKPKGKGTGLGLATCQTIVQQSGGHIRVESEVGRGTTFKIYFPRVEEPLDVPASASQPGPLPVGTETLLLVEDEPSLRYLAEVVLQAQGYQMLSAANGQDALRMAREHKGSPIRLVVTDVIMPVMGGRMMAEWLKATYPDLKILFTSGYTDESVAHHGVLEAGIDFLAKPYTRDTLVRKVREMLDR